MIQAPSESQDKAPPTSASLAQIHSFNNASPTPLGAQTSSPAPETLPAEVADPPLAPKSKRFFRPFSRRRLVLAIGDLMMANTCLFVTEIFGTQLNPTWNSIWSHFYWFLTLSVLWLAVGSFFRIYELRLAYNLPDSLKYTLLTAGSVSFLNLIIPVITPVLPQRRLEVTVFLVLMLAGTSLWRFIFARSFVHPGFNRRALVIGAGGAGQTMVKIINKLAGKRYNRYVHNGYYLLGFIDDDSNKQSKTIQGLSVLGTCEDLVKLTKELRPDDIILAITDRSRISPKMFNGILACRELGVSIVSMQSLYQKLTNQVPLEHSGRNLEVIIPLELSTCQRIYPVFRDIADIMTAILGLVLFGLAIPLVWTINYFTSPGPLLYKQERVGKGGQVFNILKFRSMVVAAERETGVAWAKANDSRVTPFGRFMRKSRIDELPQFWNVLRGEMSLIGPRPERQCLEAILEQEIPFYRLRHAVKPGITGWAQVQYGYGASVEDAFVKLSYDFYYIKNQSVFLDLMILWKSFSVVFGFKGR